MLLAAQQENHIAHTQKCAQPTAVCMIFTLVKFGVKLLTNAETNATAVKQDHQPVHA